jgi:hypothetical protein
MEQWAAYFYFTVTLAYAVDSYTANLDEMLIIMNIGIANSKRGWRLSMDHQQSPARPTEPLHKGCSRR